MMVLGPTVAARWQEGTIELAAFVFIPVLILAPRGIPIVIAIAGLAAASLIWSRGSPPISSVRTFALLVSAVLVLGAVSTLWAIDPKHSIIIALRLAGLFAAGLCLVAAAPLISPQRVLLLLATGIGAGGALAMIELATGGALSGLAFTRPFHATRMAFAASALAILVAPLATVDVRGARRIGMLVIVAIALATIVILPSSTAKGAIPIAVIVGALFYAGQQAMPRIAASVAVLVVLTAPLTFAKLAQFQWLLQAVDGLKFSLWHRLMIWSFVGDRIAEHPLIGWGLDSSRAIPGGSDLIGPTLPPWLPLHPHNASLQLWLELGLPGAILFALLIGYLFLALGRAPWPRLYRAGCAAGMTVGLATASDAFGIWNETWQGILWFSAFLALVLGRLRGPVN